MTTEQRSNRTDPLGIIDFFPVRQDPTEINGIAITDANRFSEFTFSHSFNHLDYKALQSWVEWFNSRGIPAVIGHTWQGFAVYRNDLVPVPQDEDY